MATEITSDVVTSALPASAEENEVRRNAFQRLLRDPQAVITGSIILVFIVLGLLANVIPAHGPNEVVLSATNAPPGTEGYPLGADATGRDILSRLLHSINTAMVAGIIGAGIALIIGMTLGLIGGYFDRFRTPVEWGATIIQTFPGLLLLIVLMPLTGGDYRWTMAIFGVLLTPGIYRIVRNQTVGVSRELYVDAARVSGVTDFRILGRHILSVVRGPVIVATTFLFGSAIGTQAGLAFLGVGSKEIPSFGSMISDGFRNLYIAPSQYIWPAVALGVLNGAFVLFGNALRDTFEGARPKAEKIEATAVVEGFAADDVADSGQLVQVRDLGIAYRSPGGHLNEVVRGVDLEIRMGETLGLVGESGSGKTQTAFGVLGVLPAEAIVTRGSVRLEGRELLGMSQADLNRLRGSSIAYIPQEPMANLDPVYTVGRQLVEGIMASTQVSKAAAKERALELLGRVGIPDPARTFGAYPHEISGGMAQRVLIAGAIAPKPKLLIADEPTTALDVTVQADILDLLRDLQAEMGMGIILVTHNFGVVADICDRLAVMQQGEIVESGTTVEVFANPQHSYTKMLLNSILDEETIRTDPPMAAAGAREGAR
ncbi:dipeptide/oligopeptide/nickel ABC transporter permease/ATP-binding protein [Demequina sp. NBRC 110057]|uniref:dipeptide/oligopeptide/nickel ABC transporter permease/ATP-binding protein n=1 Tax=Demequina sp. NBRC 110057 TaxID=1570346 RepID=UPI0009FC8778|nr:dipeptide/oligopeptide/nickel ABC transporter permease/ATP-binding protein [Demequina sp. NBRC 110057]